MTKRNTPAKTPDTTDPGTSTIPTLMGRISLLPNRRPKAGTGFLRQTNGRETLTITPATPDGWAYGMTPRKFLMVCATLKRRGDQCVDAKRRRITFGDSYRRLMRMMGFGGHSDARKRRQMAEQIRNLMQTSIGYERMDGEGGRSTVQGLGFRIGEAYLFEFQGQGDGPMEGSGGRNFVQFSQQGWELLDGYPVLTDDVRRLGRSPLAFDVYMHLACRVYELGRSTRTIPWTALYEQYGADFTRPRDFKSKIVNEVLPRIRDIWPELQVEAGADGLVLHPSPSPLVREQARRSIESVDPGDGEDAVADVGGEGGAGWVTVDGVRLFGRGSELTSRRVSAHLYGSVDSESCPVCGLYGGVNSETHGR